MARPKTFDLKSFNADGITALKAAQNQSRYATIQDKLGNKVVMTPNEAGLILSGHSLKVHRNKETGIYDLND